MDPPTDQSFTSCEEGSITPVRCNSKNGRRKSRSSRAPLSGTGSKKSQPGNMDILLVCCTILFLVFQFVPAPVHEVNSPDSAAGAIASVHEKRYAPPLSLVDQLKSDLSSSLRPVALSESLLNSSTQANSSSATVSVPVTNNPNGSSLISKTTESQKEQAVGQTDHAASAEQTSRATVEAAAKSRTSSTAKAGGGEDSKEVLPPAPMIRTNTLNCFVKPCLCLGDLRATKVMRRDEGPFFTSDPVWPETICVSLAPRTDGRTCFDIRDDFDPAFPPDMPPLLHFGCAKLNDPWLYGDLEIMLSGGATLRLTLLPTEHIPPPTLPSPPSPPNPPTWPVYRKSQACYSDWCKVFTDWVEDRGSKFFRMWGPAWELSDIDERGCWHIRGGHFWFDSILAGHTCDRNWMQGTPVAPEWDDRPPFSAPAPALLGFDEACQFAVSKGMKGADTLNSLPRISVPSAIADKCVQANRNVLRLIDPTSPWDMCQNLEWQLCALFGRLPGQDGIKVSFATAPKELKLAWWNNPSLHPTYKPIPDGFSLGDVYFAEVAVIFSLCYNKGDLFTLEVGEMFECQFDARNWQHLVAKFLGDV